jgi:hypothetical protein
MRIRCVSREACELPEPEELLGDIDLAALDDGYTSNKQLVLDGCCW